MFLINISSNYKQKFSIGSALNLLNDLGDMYVSDVFKTSDRQGGTADYYNCCVQLCCVKSNSSLSLDELVKKTKAIEEQLGRKPEDKQINKVIIDIDVLASKTNEQASWGFLENRLPLTQDVIWGLSDLQVDFSHVSQADGKTEPATPQDWWG